MLRMPVRPIRPEEAAEAAAMMRELWPTPHPYDFSDEMVLVWERDGDRGLGGFISFSLRPWAEGCDSAPVPYIEGWWVAPDLRGTGVGRALVTAVERWCVEHGYGELGSDVELENDASLRAHAALGFEPTLRLQFFRKRLR
jgi:aminoglycoside 6'-N-acetyltransferase I